jgi:hypothetical protein
MLPWDAVRAQVARRIHAALRHCGDCKWRAAGHSHKIGLAMAHCQDGTTGYISKKVGSIRVT